MVRTERDTWDLATSVGATATMVAAARAAATRRADPVINDPFAEPLVRAVGLDMFSRVAGGEPDSAAPENEPDRDPLAGIGFSRMTDTFAARTRYFDDFLAEAGAAGLRQVVILASGLDARPYRLSWPSGTTIYEIDQPEVIAFKTSTLSGLGAVPATDHRTVGIDLRDDWPAALRRAGFDAAQPTAWLAEGLLIGFLPPEAEDLLLDNITSLSAPGSRVAVDSGSAAAPSAVAQQQMRIMAERWREHGVDVDITTLTYPGEHHDAASYLQAQGWQTTTTTLADIFAAAGLPPLHNADLESPAASVGYVRARLG